MIKRTCDCLSGDATNLLDKNIRLSEVEICHPQTVSLVSLFVTLKAQFGLECQSDFDLTPIPVSEDQDSSFDICVVHGQDFFTRFTPSSTFNSSESVNCCHDLNMAVDISTYDSGLNYNSSDRICWTPKMVIIHHFRSAFASTNPSAGDRI